MTAPVTLFHLPADVTVSQGVPALDRAAAELARVFGAKLTREVDHLGRVHYRLERRFVPAEVSRG